LAATGCFFDAGDVLTQGINPIRLIADSSGNFIYVLDQIASNSSSCTLALGAGVTSCGDITAFKVDSNTGRLTADRERAGDLGKRTAIAVLPYSLGSDRLCALFELHSHLERNARHR